MKLCLFAAIAAAPFLMAADTIQWPAPGLYRIDSDTTFSGGSGASATQHVDGAAGDTTSQGQTYPGAGPNTVCVAHGAPPAQALAANRCHTQYPGAVATTCDEGTTVDESWRQTDATHWKRHVHTENGAPSAAQWPEATRQAMEPVIAGLEAQVRDGAPEEKDPARQQLAALKGQMGGAKMITDTDETWTLVSATCK